MASVVVNDGKGIIGGFLAGVGSGRGLTAPTFLDWGIGTATATAADSALQTKTGVLEARTNGTRSAITTTNTNDTYQLVGTITSTGTHAITEMGAFDAAGAASPVVGGFLFVRSDFAAINVTSGDSIAFTVKVQFT